MARVDIRKVPDMPPETKRDEYLHEQCDLIPPGGRGFHDPLVPPSRRGLGVTARLPPLSKEAKG